MAETCVRLLDLHTVDNKVDPRGEFTRNCDRLGKFYEEGSTGDEP